MRRNHKGDQEGTARRVGGKSVRSGVLSQMDSVPDSALLGHACLPSPGRRDFTQLFAPQHSHL
ncbi:hypothetical protein Cadr_000026556 [Camelus dromedarius]|uniref:Uncharacterized protein n=1 Tax=Camelus dromedarius TaxID=9838 RepID=A0A5N4CHC6_CAMDR|nr:hypothetical protein Cadr_000026556 [Camelus dromedarius]